LFEATINVKINHQNVLTQSNQASTSVNQFNRTKFLS